MTKKYVQFSGRMVMIGFGSIGKGVLPLILRHIDLDPKKIVIVTADAAGKEVADEYGIEFHVQPLKKDNYRAILDPRVGKGDFIVNLSVDVSSVSLMEYAKEKGALYLDTCIEPWPGGYTDTSISPSLRSNYALRETALKLNDGGKGPTAVITHGANPGLVSHFVKQALLDMAKDTGKPTAPPTTREGWAALAQSLNVKVIHIAERDTQIPTKAKEVGEFVNTWSIDGFVSEGSQPAELGWGSHEKELPPQGRRHEFGRQSAIYLLQPGAGTRVRSWTPLEGPYIGWLITHGESISIPDYLSVKQGDKTVYRPTCHYAYHPCDAAVLSVHEFQGKGWVQQDRQRLIVDEVVSGIDELGVLLCGNDKGVYWYGSRLSIDEARALCPHNNATSLQVTAPVLSGIIWAIENPDRGIVEPDEMDYARNLEICMPYLGPVVGVWGGWTPLEGREKLFAEDLDKSDPWQFKNILVK